MRRVQVYRNGILAGILTGEDCKHYVFRYDDSYFANSDMPASSLTLLKSQQEYKSKFLVPFFFNMLSEGVNKKPQCKQLRIDLENNFGLLGATAMYDTIGAITIKPLSK